MGIDPTSSIFTTRTTTRLHPKNSSESVGNSLKKGMGFAREILVNTSSKKNETNSLKNTNNVS